jgi:adenosylmethionine-8-amino-7-oxononanoate aminotransferase
MDHLTKRDRASIWHPFTQMLTAPDAIVITHGEGSYLYSHEGTAYLDGISSWWVNLHGHTHPYICDKIKGQLDKLEHVLFAGFTHPPAIELAERLLPLLPGEMSKIFYSDNGSTAAETALKMALQYWYLKEPATRRKKVICMRGGYHGDTFGAMSAAGKNLFNKPFWSHLFEVEMIDPPLTRSSLTQLKAILEQETAACFIFEPLIMGVGGMLIYPAEELNHLMRLCREYQVLLIADEVMTGFGRTGSLFACDQLEEKPDLICLSKGLTGGFLPLGATACTEEVYTTFLSEDPAYALLHGHSYTANPLACTSALASLDLLQTAASAKDRKRISEQHKQFCSLWNGHPRLKRCESLGTILVLEYATKENSSYLHSLRDHLYNHFLSHGILLRPLGNVVYVIPPYCFTNEQLEHIYSQIISTLEHFP